MLVCPVPIERSLAAGALWRVKRRLVDEASLAIARSFIQPLAYGYLHLGNLPLWSCTEKW